MNTDLSKANHQVRVGSEKSFGLVFSALFFILALLPTIRLEQPNQWFLYASLLAFVLSIFAPQIFKHPNILWFKFGMLLGRVVSPIVMGLVFIAGFLPISLLLRAAKKDPLSRAIEKSAPTYWLTRRDKLQSMKRQF